MIGSPSRKANRGRPVAHRARQNASPALPLSRPQERILRVPGDLPHLLRHRVLPSFLMSLKITPLNNGPLRVEGEFEICDPTGASFGLAASASMGVSNRVTNVPHVIILVSPHACKSTAKAIARIC